MLEVAEEVVGWKLDVGRYELGGKLVAGKVEVKLGLLDVVGLVNEGGLEDGALDADEEAVVDGTGTAVVNGREEVASVASLVPDAREVGDRVELMAISVLVACTVVKGMIVDWELAISPGMVLASDAVTPVEADQPIEVLKVL